MEVNRPSAAYPAHKTDHPTRKGEHLRLGPDVVFVPDSRSEDSGGCKGGLSRMAPPWPWRLVGRRTGARVAPHVSTRKPLLATLETR
jgi:hypothetical protein